MPLREIPDPAASPQGLPCGDPKQPSQAGVTGRETAMGRAAESLTAVRERLLKLRNEYQQRVETIHAHARSPLEADSSEQAAQLGNVEVVQALEAEATAEIVAINAALSRLDAGTYGTCVSCGDTIGAARLAARPASAECVDCAGEHARH